MKKNQQLATVNFKKSNIIPIINLRQYHKNILAKQYINLKWDKLI